MDDGGLRLRRRSALPLSTFTLRYWLSDSGATLSVIGLTANIGLAYSLKFCGHRSRPGRQPSRPDAEIGPAARLAGDDPAGPRRSRGGCWR